MIDPKIAATLHHAGESDFAMAWDALSNEQQIAFAEARRKDILDLVIWLWGHDLTFHLMDEEPTPLRLLD
jgi:hypothetical protein